MAASEQRLVLGVSYHAQPRALPMQPGRRQELRPGSAGRSASTNSSTKGLDHGALPHDSVVARRARRLALLLKGEGHHTATAEDGRKALEVAMQGTIRPDLLVADYNLPKSLNGLQVVAELRKTLGYEIPAII